MGKETVTLLASVLALIGSLLSLYIGSSLAIKKERRQMLWSKELDRFFALEESVGVLVENLGGHESIQDREEDLLQKLLQLSNDAGRFARYPEVRQSIRDLHNVLSRLYVAKRDYQDERETRNELEPAYRKLLQACDSVVKRVTA
jgi:hypothetical protein